MPRLVIKRGEGVGRDHALGGGTCVVGRDPSITFPLDDHLVSRQHFQVTQEGGVYWVEDLGSTNGTIVNGRRVARVQLVDGDRIQVGGTTLEFVQKDILGTTSAPAAKARDARPETGVPAPDAPKPTIQAPVRRRRRR